MTDDVQLLTFHEALSDAERHAQPHLLLGNGFSIACRADCFTYAALLQEADFAQARGDVRQVFELLATTDFERVISMLRSAAALIQQYGPAQTALRDDLLHDAEVIREALAQTLAAKHPNVPFDIDDAEYVAVRTFLSRFKKIYSLNYDMLLYWAVMQEHGPPVQTNDGFTNADDSVAPYVVWEPYRDFGSQNLFFLHGGLHLYDAEEEAEIQKITWSRTGVPLVDQIREALATGRYPLIVTEGTAIEKEAKVLHNAYLNHALRSFARIQEVRSSSMGTLSPPTTSTCFAGSKRGH